MGRISAGLAGIILSTVLLKTPAQAQVNPEKIPMPPTSNAHAYIHEYVSPDVHFPYNTYKRDTNRLTQAWLEEQGILTYIAKGPYTPPRPQLATIRIIRQDEFINLIAREGVDTVTATTFQGFADMKNNQAYVIINTNNIDNALLCPSRFVLTMAATVIHEYLHLIGLYHPDQTSNTTIPPSALQIPNIMLHSALSSMVQNTPPEDDPICSKQPRELTTKDIHSLPLSPVQRAQAQDFLARGFTWTTLEAFEFDLEKYMDLVTVLNAKEGTTAQTLLLVDPFR